MWSTGPLLASAEHQLLEVDSIFESGEIPLFWEGQWKKESDLLNWKEYNKQCLTISDSDDLWESSRGLQNQWQYPGCYGRSYETELLFFEGWKISFRNRGWSSFAIHKIKLRKNERVLQKRFGLFSWINCPEPCSFQTVTWRLHASMTSQPSLWFQRRLKEKNRSQLSRRTRQADSSRWKDSKRENIVRKKVLSTDGEKGSSMFRSFQLFSEGDKPMVVAIAMDITEWKLAQRWPSLD